MITSPFDFFLAYIVRGVLPATVLKKIDQPEKFQLVISYIKTSISLSPIYVRGPEIVLRIFLFCMIFVFRLIEIFSFKHFKLSNSVKLLKKMHPLLDDGIRLYLFLAMFAVFEDDSFRQDHGFPAYSEILKPFDDLKSRKQSKK